jgi:predicted metal-dependent phosphoesterase TrpH
MIDLHTHSTFSDGVLTPRQLADLAREIGLTAIALTDHDSTNGIEQFLAACRDGNAAGARQLTGLAGVEISADVSRGTLHMLGYMVDPSNRELQDVLVQIRDGREIRNQKILAKLNALGINLSWEEVAALAGEDVVGRPHFAQAMLARNYVDSTTDAFERFLAKGKPAYTDRLRFTPERSVAAIRSAGGVAVLAHPFTLDLGRKELRAYVASLKDLGLAGLEVYYSEHNPEQTQEYLALARDLDLVATGGSDFHGDTVNAGIKLGRGFGSLRVPDEIVDQLHARANGA